MKRQKLSRALSSTFSVKSAKSAKSAKSSRAAKVSESPDPAKSPDPESGAFKEQSKASVSPDPANSSEPAPVSPEEQSAKEVHEYVNSLEDSPRWWLSARAMALRSAAALGFSMFNYACSAASETLWLDSTLSSWKGKEKIRVDVWKPKRRTSHSPGRNGSASSGTKLPALISFHGGGFVVGQGTDDSIWFDTVMRAVDMVVFSVSYRMAPEYPFPAPVEDCADAISQITQRAEEFGINRDRIVVSGFSAGGNLALASWVVLQDPQRWGYQLPNPPPKLAGFALFYPVLDWRLDRPSKRMLCQFPDRTLPKGMTDLFDASYLYPHFERAALEDPRLSPGLMSDKLLDTLPAVHLCLCEYDMLESEGHAFAERLKIRGKEATVRVVKGEKHAWDKPLPLAPKPSVREEYGKAIELIRSWVGEGVDTSA